MSNTCFINKISNITLEEFNTLLEENKPFNLESYNTIDSNTIVKIKETIIDYNIDIKLLVCSKCKIYLNTSIDLIIKHLLEKHKDLYKRNNKENKELFNNSINNIKDFINTNTFNTLNNIEKLEFNKYYYNNLEIVLGYKSKLCNYINITRKNVNIHLNKEHNSKAISTLKQSNIIEDIPILRIKGFSRNRIVDIIPKIITYKNLELLKNSSSSLINSSSINSNKSKENIAKSIASFKEKK